MSQQPDTTPNPPLRIDTVEDMTTTPPEDEYTGNPDLTEAGLERMPDDEFAAHITAMLNEWLADAGEKLREAAGDDMSLKGRLELLRDSALANMPFSDLLTLAAMAVWRLSANAECDASGWSRSKDVSITRYADGTSLFAAFSPSIGDGAEELRVLRRALMSPFMEYRLEVDKEADGGPSYDLRIRGTLVPFDGGMFFRDQVVPGSAGLDQVPPL